MDEDLPADLPLFRQSHIRKPEYWQFIRLVAPSHELPPNRNKWLSEDAVGMYCIKCKEQYHFERGMSFHVRNHMKTFHPAECPKDEPDLQENKLVTMMPEKMDRGKLWSFYEKTGMKHFNFHIVKCILCLRKNPSNQSTIVGRLENLRRHLDHYHRDEMNSDTEIDLPPAKRLRKSKDMNLWNYFDKTGQKHYNFHIVECRLCKENNVTTSLVGRLEKLRQHLSECAFNVGGSAPVPPSTPRTIKNISSSTAKPLSMRHDRQLVEFIATNNVDIGCVESVTMRGLYPNPPNYGKFLEILSKYSEDLYINDQNKIKSYCNIHDWNQCTLSIVEEDCKEQTVYLKFPTNLQCIYKEDCFIQSNDQIEQMLLKHDEIKSVVSIHPIPALNEKFSHISFLSCYTYQLTYLASQLLKTLQPSLMKTAKLIDEIYFSPHFTAALNELLPSQVKLIPLNSSKTSFSHLTAVFDNLLQLEDALREFSTQNPSIVNEFAQDSFWNELKDSERCFRNLIQAFYFRETRTMADVLADYIQFYNVFQQHSTKNKEMTLFLQDSFNDLQEHALYLLAFSLHPIYSKEYSSVFHDKMVLQFANIYYKKLVGDNTTQLHQQTMKWINRRLTSISAEDDQMNMDPIKFWEGLRSKAPELSELAIKVFSISPQTTLSADYFTKMYGFPFGFNNDMTIKGQFIQFHQSIFKQTEPKITTESSIPIIQLFRNCNTEKEAYEQLFQSWQQTLKFPTLAAKTPSDTMTKNSFQDLHDRLHTFRHQEPTNLYRVLYSTKLKLQDLPKLQSLTTTLV